VTENTSQEEQYLIFARKKGSMSFQDATTYDIPERRYRMLITELVSN